LCKNGRSTIRTKNTPSTELSADGSAKYPRDIAIATISSFGTFAQNGPHCSTTLKDWSKSGGKNVQVSESRWLLFESNKNRSKPREPENRRERPSIEI
jgi:hypothetical protein